MNMKMMSTILTLTVLLMSYFKRYIEMKVCIKMLIHIDDDIIQLSRPMWISVNKDNELVVNTIYVNEKTAQNLSQNDFDRIVDELVLTKKATLWKVV